MFPFGSIERSRSGKPESATSSADPDVLRFGDFESFALYIRQMPGNSDVTVLVVHTAQERYRNKLQESIRRAGRAITLHDSLTSSRTPLNDLADVVTMGVVIPSERGETETFGGVFTGTYPRTSAIQLRGMVEEDLPLVGHTIQEGFQIAALGYTGALLNSLSRKNVAMEMSLPNGHVSLGRADCLSMFPAVSHLPAMRIRNAH